MWNIWRSNLEMVCLHTTVIEVLLGRKMQLSDKYSPPLFDHDLLVFRCYECRWDGSSFLVMVTPCKNPLCVPYFCRLTLNLSNLFLIVYNVQSPTNRLVKCLDNRVTWVNFPRCMCFFSSEVTRWKQSSSLLF